MAGIVPAMIACAAAGHLPETVLTGCVLTSFPATRGSGRPRCCPPAPEQRPRSPGVLCVPDLEPQC